MYFLIALIQVLLGASLSLCFTFNLSKMTPCWCSCSSFLHMVELSQIMFSHFILNYCYPYLLMYLPISYTILFWVTLHPSKNSHFSNSHCLNSFFLHRLAFDTIKNDLLCILLVFSPFLVFISKEEGTQLCIKENKKFFLLEKNKEKEKKQRGFLI